MTLKLKSTLWRIIGITLTLTFWLSVVAAQEEVEAVAEEATNFGLIWPLFLAGLAAIAALGFKYSQDTDEGSD